MSEDNESPQKDRITAESALEDSNSSQVQSAELDMTWQAANSEAAYIAEDRWIRARGLRQHFHHKGWWSGVILATIVFMVIFESSLISLVGLGIWDFRAYPWLVPTLMIQFLTQIVSLGLLVVRSLFKDSAH